MGKAAQLICLLLITTLPSVASAVQQDAEYLVHKKQFGKQWGAEDKQVLQILAALEKTFGKKPNIVFILAGDIGFTELGSHGDGKVRSFATPNLNRMADEGVPRGSNDKSISRSMEFHLDTRMRRQKGGDSPRGKNQ